MTVAGAPSFFSLPGARHSVALILFSTGNA